MEEEQPISSGARFLDAIGHPVPPIQILDIGAMIEGRETYRGLVEAGMAKVVGIEPNADEFAKLQNRGGPYSYRNVVLGAGGPTLFHLTAYAGNSSLLEPNPAIIDLFETLGTEGEIVNFKVEARKRVTTTRLDDLGPEVAPDLIKIDVQGAELTILGHGETKLRSALVVESEVEFVPLYKDQPLLGDVHCFMRDRGFMFHKMFDVAGRSYRPVRPSEPARPISQLLWADAIFVRDITRLDRYGDDDLLKAAAILHIGYRSYDLAAFLLREFDRRRVTQTYDGFIKQLQAERLDPFYLNIKLGD
jgi:FkbM family methyltransferase